MPKKKWSPVERSIGDRRRVHSEVSRYQIWYKFFLNCLIDNKIIVKRNNNKTWVNLWREKDILLSIESGGQSQVTGGR